MHTSIRSARIIFLVSILAAAFLLAACSDDATSPEPPGGNGGEDAGVFKADRHGLYLLSAWAHSPELTYATAYLGVAKITDAETVVMSLEGLATVRGIWGSSPDNVFVVGYSAPSTDGEIYRSNGKSWKRMLHPFQEAVNDVFGLGPDTVFVVTKDGKLGRFDGSGWTVVHEHPDGEFNAVWASSTNDIYIAGRDSLILHYDGVRWEDQSVTESGHFVALWGSGPGDVYALAGQSIYHDSGTGWAEELDAGVILMDIDGASADNIYVVGEQGTLLHFTGFGWAPVVLPGGEDAYLFGISMSSETSAVVVGYPGVVARLSGISWTLEHKGRDLTWRGVMGVAPDAVYAVAEQGTLGVYDGSEWSYLDAPGDFSPMDICAVARDEVLVAGPDDGGGGVYRFDGSRWSNLHSTRSDLYAVWVVGAEVFAAGDAGAMTRFDGASWADTALTSQKFLDIWGTSGDDIFAVGEEGTIFHFDGADWTDMSLTTTFDVNCVFGTSASDVRAAGMNGLMLRYDGYIWRSDIMVFPVETTSLWGSTPNDYWAGGTSGILLRYDGTHWDMTVAVPMVSLSGIWGDRAGTVFMCGPGDHLGRYVGY